MCEMNQQLLRDFQGNKIILSSSKHQILITRVSKVTVIKNTLGGRKRGMEKVFSSILQNMHFKREFMQTPHTRRIYKCKNANLVYLQRMLLTSTVQ